jgi:hypothetical protein
MTAFGTFELILLAVIFGIPVILLLVVPAVRKRMKGNDGNKPSRTGH